MHLDLQSLPPSFHEMAYSYCSGKPGNSKPKKNGWQNKILKL